MIISHVLFLRQINDASLKFVQPCILRKDRPPHPTPGDMFDGEAFFGFLRIAREVRYCTKKTKKKGLWFSYFFQEKPLPHRSVNTTPPYYLIGLQDVTLFNDVAR